MRYVLEGSVRKSGDDLRITAQLIDALKGHHLWAERYDRQLNDIFSLQGAIFGDPDFDLIQIRAGTNFGLPSPGATTLTELPGGDFQVDSFFDVFYEIEFVGEPGSDLEGFAGTIFQPIGSHH